MQQLTNLTAAPSHLIKGDLFLESAGLILFPNLAFSNSLTLHWMWKIWINRPYRREIPYFYLSPSRSLVKMTKGLIYTSYIQICLVKAIVFPVVTYVCESWTIKKAEQQRINAFELWCWRRLLRVPWTARRSNLSILKEISPGCSLEGLMLKLKL